MRVPIGPSIPQAQAVTFHGKRLRLKYAGACYHVLNRGIYRRHLFASVGAKESFYRCLDEACTSFGWLVHAIVIMSNHSDPALRDEKYLKLAWRWAIGSTASRVELREKLRTATEQRARFGFLGTDRDAVCAARSEWWEQRLRRFATGFGINLAQLPRKKSAVEKLTLAAAMKEATSVSMAWLALRLQIGATDSGGSPLTRFRAAGAKQTTAFRSNIPVS